MNQTLSVLLLKDGAWTAQCLEHDVAAQGKTIQEAIFELARTLMAEVCLCAERGDDLDSIPPAPCLYWRLYHDNGQIVDSRPAPPFKPDCGLLSAFAPPGIRELRIA